MPNEIVATSKRTKNRNRFSAHGISIIDYINTDVELWLKVLAYIMHWYLNPKHDGKTFFMKYKTIVNIFKKWGFECTERGMEEAFRILKTPEDKGGVGLIKVEYADTTKANWIAQGYNPRKWIYRKVYLNWAKLRKYMSVFTAESKTLKNLASKSRFKKLIYKRFMSYTWTMQALFDKEMKEAKIEKYTTANKMFYGFIYTYSRKYYDPSKLIKKYVPEHMIDLQKKQDMEGFVEAMELMRAKGYVIGPKIKPTTSFNQEPSNNTSGKNKELIKAFMDSMR